MTVLKNTIPRKLSFPEGFLWGAATASYQVEGGIENNDWAKAAREGKVPEAGRACDHYHRYEQDFDIAKSLGHTVHRFAIEWARIEPEEGVFDEKEIEHYRAVIQALRARGIEPMINIWHFTLPRWFAESGGFFRKDAPDVFARYCSRMATEYGSEVKLWTTINEPLVYSGKGFTEGAWPPFEKSRVRTLRVIRRLITAHKKAYRGMKEIRPDIQIGITKHNIHFNDGGNIFARPVALVSRWFWNRRFLNAIQKHQDFIGLNFYFRASPLHDTRNDGAPRSDIDWHLHPESIYYPLIELARYRVPLYVTENGLADEYDVHRAWFIQKTLEATHAAIKDGVDIRGYMHWSLLDNFEWALGYSPRFGLVHVNYETLERTPRPSAKVYEKICRTNSLTV
jgi:beta-glucosidase